MTADHHMSNTTSQAAEGVGKVPNSSNAPSVQSADDLLREVYHKIKPCVFRHAENCWRCGWFTRTEKALGLPFEAHIMTEKAK